MRGTRVFLRAPQTSLTALLLSLSLAGGWPAGAAEEPDANAVAPSAYERTDEFEDDDDLDEIIITARKRREFLQDTPVSVTVLSGEQLERRGVKSLEQISDYVPNLSAFSGVQQGGTFLSRGMGQRDALVSLDPGIGLYVDDAYIARAHGALLSTVDIERIEVLRGPQGTLYGKNTIGGAVKLITRKPGPDPEVSGSFTGGNFRTLQSTATMNVPLVDHLLYSRFSFASRDSDGYNRNVTLDDEENDDNLLAFRGQLRMLPADDVTLDFTGHWSREREEGKGAKCRVSNPALPGFLPAPQNLLFGQLHADCAAAEARSTYEFASNLGDTYHLTSYGASMTGDWDVGPIAFLDDLDLKSVSSFREQQVDDGALDIDATQSTLVPLGGPFFVPLNLEQRMVTTQTQTQLSQELQAIATALEDKLKITSGVYAFWEQSDGGSIDSHNFGTVRRDRIEIQNASYAAYGQASYAPWDWLELTGGLRYTAEDRQADRTVVSGGSPPESPFETDEKHFDKWTPMAGLALSAPREMLDDTPVRSGILYFNYSQGWKSGGFSTRRNPALFSLSDYREEEVDNFELGLKLDTFDSKLLVNASFFYALYRDMQLTVQRVNPLNPTDIGSAISNAGRSTIQGFEIETVLRPIQDLAVRVGWGLTDARYQKFNDNGLDRSNENFFNVPKWNLDALVEYAFDMDVLGLSNWGSITPLVHVYYQSDTDNHFTAAGFQSGKFQQDAYAKLDLRINWDLGDDRTRISLFMNNVTDEEIFNSSVDLTDTIGTGSVYYDAPRTFGATVSYRWAAWGGLGL